MLTATYSLVAIAAEQDNARGMLSRFRQYLQATWKGFQGFDFAFLEKAFNKLLQFDAYCRNRKLERYLIPALRSVSKEADVLIGELESLSNKGLSLIRFVREQIASAVEVTTTKVSDIFAAMEHYCNYLFNRLEREERELMPLARRLLSIEDWFNIAAQFLSTDGGRRTKPRSRRIASAPSPSGVRADR